jgi:branched-chain amino acid transport system ATP-binding protein
MLEVNGLAVSYGAARAVHALDLNVEAGEIVVLAGPNGAGKSSVVNAIAGLLQPQAGTVVFDGKNLTRASAAARVREGIALVVEGRGVFAEMTVAENLELGGYSRGRARRAQGGQYSLPQVIAMFPRLGERMSQDAETLSGGEQQMLVIGRALMSAPRLLLLDEPSLGLAPTVVAEIAKVIKRLAHEHGIGVLVCEQNAVLGLDLADRGYVLQNGHIVAQGRCSDLREQHDLLSLYLGGVGQTAESRGPFRQGTTS